MAGSKKMGSCEAADDRKLAGLQSMVFAVIGTPIEDATAVDRELLKSTLSQKEMHAVNEYSRLMQVAVGSVDSSKPHNRNKEEQLGIRLDSWLKTSLEEIADRQELSVAQLVRRVLRDFVAKSLPQVGGS
jgi:predicted HicB family RNase H-like nuclease